MAIGDTRLDHFLKRGKLLKEMSAWKSAFDVATKEQIIEWVKSQLKDKGVDGRGIVIGNYSYATELITKGRKQQGDHYTLEDTGDFYRSIEVDVTEALVFIVGNGRKGKDNLYDKYGDYITTLTDENIEKLKEIIREKYITYIRKVLQID
jgi:hypothetical protein